MNDDVKNTTKEGINVMTGQVWRDLDKRKEGRHCKIVSIYCGQTTMQRCLVDGTIISEKRTSVAVKRMCKGATGWELVRGATSEPALPDAAPKSEMASTDCGPMTATVADQVYDVLVAHARAQDNVGAREAFVLQFSERATTTDEYRFQGALGYGGKFRYPGYTVDCYPEDLNPARQAMIDATNGHLQLLRERISVR